MDTYESQNDDQLAALHSKIRSLRGVTTDIHADVERQNSVLDDTNNTFSSFTNALAHSSRRAAQTFNLSSSSGFLRQHRLLLIVVAALLGLWLLWRALAWFSPHSAM